MKPWKHGQREESCPGPRPCLKTELFSLVIYIYVTNTEVDLLVRLTLTFYWTCREKTVYKQCMKSKYKVDFNTYDK